LLIDFFIEWLARYKFIDFIPLPTVLSLSLITILGLGAKSSAVNLN
jgi:hypothetical protein